MFHVTEYVVMALGVILVSFGVGVAMESFTYGSGVFGLLSILLGIWVYVRESGI